MVTIIVDRVKNDDHDNVENVREKHPGRAKSEPTIIINLRSVKTSKTNPVGSVPSKFVSITVGITLPHSPNVLKGHTTYIYE
jgi:hypothetical protein